MSHASSCVWVCFCPSSADQGCGAVLAGRYWGAPIPMIHCSSCGPVPVPEVRVLVPQSASVPDFCCHPAERPSRCASGRRSVPGARWLSAAVRRGSCVANWSVPSPMHLHKAHCCSPFRGCCRLCAQCAVRSARSPVLPGQHLRWFSAALPLRMLVDSG